LYTNRIDKLFSRTNSAKVTSLFITAGYPELQSTPEFIAGLAQNGADMIEVGMPYSDPLADGPAIQYASNTALDNGITIDRIFENITQAREETEVPLVLMGYINPVLQYGVKEFCRQAQLAGVDGLIIPDLPPEESGLLEKHAKEHQLKLIFLIAPNTAEERMRLIDKKSEGFVYCVSVTGVTGAREGDEVTGSVNRFIERVKQNITKNPVLIGFGIKTQQDAQKVARRVEGYIVGSALINTIKENYPNRNWKDKAYEYVHYLKND